MKSGEIFSWTPLKFMIFLPQFCTFELIKKWNCTRKLTLYINSLCHNHICIKSSDLYIIFTSFDFFWLVWAAAPRSETYFFRNLKLKIHIFMILSWKLILIGRIWIDVLIPYIKCSIPNKASPEKLNSLRFLAFWLWKMTICPYI